MPPFERADDTFWAFPSGIGPENPQTGYREANEEGMTLRDYFAAKAMEAILARGDVRKPIRDVADQAYEMAEAMLAARSKVEP